MTSFKLKKLNDFNNTFFLILTRMFKKKKNFDVDLSLQSYEKVWHPDHFPDFPSLIVVCLDQQFKFK